jgi:putative inorganic carbon (HCO3(-)) transporter
VGTSLSATRLNGEVPTQSEPPTVKTGDPAPGRIFYYLLLAHTAITVLTLGSRVPGLGVIRPTLLLVAVIWAWWFAAGIRTNLTSGVSDSWGRLLVVLLVYFIVTLPFTMWPGSVLRAGVPTWFRMASFLFFCIFLCTTWQRLRLFVLVWLGCEIFRMVQPVYLHITSGYWGDSTYLGEGDFMSRLSGAPGDIVNPNGLGYIVASVLPFMHYLAMDQKRWWVKIAYVATLLVLLYGLALTGSRSAVLALAIDVLLIAWRSKYRVLVLSLAAVGLVVAVSYMSADQIDRYKSIYSSNTRNARTAHGRVAAMFADFDLGLERPIFGFGLGTSKEANWNMRHDRFIAHNMYAEALIELGLVGLGIFIAFLVSLVRGVRDCQLFLARAPPTIEGYQFMQSLTSALRVWIPMALIFFFAQYGLREADWYIMGGITGALYMLTKKAATAPTTQVVENTSPPAPSGFRRPGRPSRPLLPGMSRKRPT